MVALRALFVRSATLGEDGRIISVEFFPPDVVQSAILAQLTKQSAPEDISGQSNRVMELRAKLAACDKPDQRVYLQQQLQQAQMEEIETWSSD